MLKMFLKNWKSWCNIAPSLTYHDQNYGKKKT